VYPDIKKLKKQLDYANQRKIHYVVVIGSNEMESGTAELKDMFSGDKESIRFDQLAQRLLK
jgi:histidyl-tRNA synthetase